ncbi:MAG: hypothetical protein AAGJ46_02545 [Planctomycetota bacterium]
MTLSEDQLEWIVQEVVRRLQASSQPNSQSSNPQPQAAGELRLADRLVTTETLRGRLSGIARVVTRGDAVITPAVVDQLKDHKIELVRG